MTIYTSNVTADLDSTFSQTPFISIERKQEEIRTTANSLRNNFHINNTSYAMPKGKQAANHLGKLRYVFLHIYKKMLAHDDFQLLNTTIINFSNLIGCQKAGNQQSIGHFTHLPV